MKRLINMNLKNSVDVNRLMALHKDSSTMINLFVQEFTCRYTFVDAMHGESVAALVDCKLMNRGIEIHFEEEGSALMIKQRVPTFNMLATIDNGKARIIRAPKDKAAQKWLETSVGSRTVLSELMHIIMHAAYALNRLEGVLQKREANGIIEYRFPKDFETIGNQYLCAIEAKANKEKLLDGWDVVNLTEKQYYKVIETNQQKNIEYDMENIPLPRFCLAIYDGKETDYYFFEKKGRTICCGVTDPANYVTKYFCINLIGQEAEGIKSSLYVDDNEVGLSDWLNEVISEDGGTNWEWCADAFFIINTFMLHFGDVTMEVETKVANEGTGNRAQRRANKRNSVRLFKSYKLIKNWKTQARKKAEITCPAWGVRGHFRHLRNGKVIFVESYIKGRDRAQYKGKEYNLRPYKEA